VTEPHGGAVRGDDGLLRCPWGDDPLDYRAYHDDEWGKPVRGDNAIFERLSLEAFQCGLSWLTVLRRRESLRRAFADFDIDAVAAFTPATVAGILADPLVIRHRGKIEAVVGNARILQKWRASRGEGVLDESVWSYASRGAPPRHLGEVPSATPASADLAHRLRREGWRFIGPTSAYAALQALGVVNDHLVDCHARRSAE
jgi:DNA-3-methyladenine glycosylase I